jgi:ribosome-associated toxin RatA of RatAB toxin-antitoxin module
VQAWVNGVMLVEGPFSKLVGVWTFEALSEEACKVSLDLQFEFANKLAGMAMGKVFNQVATTMVDVFVQRADALYG